MDYCLAYQVLSYLRRKVESGLSQSNFGAQLLLNSMFPPDDKYLTFVETLERVI